MKSVARVAQGVTAAVILIILSLGFASAAEAQQCWRCTIKTFGGGIFPIATYCYCSGHEDFGGPRDCYIAGDCCYDEGSCEYFLV